MGLAPGHEGGSGDVSRSASAWDPPEPVRAYSPFLTKTASDMVPDWSPGGPNEVRRLLLDQELHGLSVGTALEVGCGSGVNALKLAERGWSVTGIDWEEQDIELATREGQEKRLDATFYPFYPVDAWEPSTKFDLVISSFAKRRVIDPKSYDYVLHTAVKALARGGTLFVVEWDSSMSTAWFVRLNQLMSPEQIAELLPELDIEKAEVRRLADNGLSASIAVVRARKPTPTAL